jgi:hypothetical protein
LADPPADVVALAELRAEARAAKDFAAADRLRDEIAASGWVVDDRPDGFGLTPRPAYDVLPSLEELPDNSAAPDTRRATVSVLVEGWPVDVRTCVVALLEHTTDDVVVQALDVGNASRRGIWDPLPAGRRPGSPCCGRTPRASTRGVTRPRSSPAMR